MRLFRQLFWIFLCLMLVGCNLFKVYKIPVQQGNVINLTILDKLRLGMTKSQAQFVLGKPLLQHVFDQDRWDYVYRLYIPDADGLYRRLTLYFDEDSLVHFESDLKRDVSDEPESK